MPARGTGSPRRVGGFVLRGLLVKAEKPGDVPVTLRIDLGASRPVAPRRSDTDLLLASRNELVRLILQRAHKVACHDGYCPRL